MQYIQNLIQNARILDVVDIAIVAFVIYKVLAFIKESRAEQLVRGLLILLATMFMSDFFGLRTLNWLLQRGMAVGVIALVVVFQPELRRGLEYMGRSKLMGPAIARVDQSKAREITRAFVSAIEDMADKKIGALMIFERETSLTDICDTGVRLGAEISKELLQNIFYLGSPLHDGAVIVRGDEIHSAACVLPLTRNRNIPTDLGTRHRAALGMTESSDCIAIIVSEETGSVSVAKDGRLRRGIDRMQLEKIFQDMYFQDNRGRIFKNFKKAVKKGRK